MRYLLKPFFICLIVSILVSVLVALVIRTLNFSNNNQKNLYSLISTLCFFPVLAPAGTIAAIPVPNILLLVLSFQDLPDLVKWYGSLWKFNIPSFFISLIVFRILSNILFFLNPIEKTVTTHENN